jgi:hypothetical protein
MKTWIGWGIMLAATSSSAERDRLDLMSEGAAKSNAGDHAGAIALYEQAYIQDADALLLPILASEYRRAGSQLDAIHYFCEYLRREPKGTQAAFSASQVVAIRGELGQVVSGKDVCEAPKPVRVDFAPRKAPARKPIESKKPSMSKREVAGIASAAVGVASLTASVLYGMKASSIASDIANHPTNEAWPDDIQALEDRGERYERRQGQFLLIGAAAVVTGGILYFTGRADRLSSETVIAPTVSPDGAGISFARGF